MIVTQKNIDDAIEQAEYAKFQLLIKISNDLKKGKELCNEDRIQFNNLWDSIWLLNDALISVEQKCITINDVWEQINFIRENSCELPKKPIVERVLNWLITNTGLYILTNNNKKILINK